MKVRASFTGTHLCDRLGPSLTDSTDPGLVHPAEPTCLIRVNSYHLATTGQHPLLPQKPAPAIFSGPLLWAEPRGLLSLEEDIPTAASCHLWPDGFLGGPGYNFGMRRFLFHPSKMTKA